MSSRTIYLIGSLRNPRVPEVANILRADGHYVYDDWYATSEDADDWWKRYEQGRGHSFVEALNGWAATHVYLNDKQHLDELNTGVLVMPCGKSAHLELGYMIGQKKDGYILLDEDPERYDCMYKFAAGVYQKLDELREALKKRRGVRGMPKHAVIKSLQKTGRADMTYKKTKKGK